jgi:capsular polysaccharide biosynthesis protein/glycosyltransferase involved in cell wall biosynthesis
LPQDLGAFVGWLKSRQRRLNAPDQDLVELFWRVHPRFQFLKSLPWGWNLLDIGAGNGGLAHWKSWLKPDRADLNLYGVDRNTGEYRELYAGWEAINLDRAMPNFAGVTLNGFFARYLLEYLGTAEQLVEWLGRRAEPGARVYLEWINPISRSLPTREQLSKHGIEVLTSNFIDDAEHKQAPDLARLGNWLSDAGFTIIASGAVDLGILGEELFARGADRDTRSMGYWSMTRSSLYTVAIKSAAAALPARERSTAASASPVAPERVPLSAAADRSASADLQLLRAKRTVLVSGLFDAVFYRATYADTRAATVEPLTHYLTEGEAEGRSPNAVFAPRYYRQRWMAGLPAGQNALLHYVEEGERSGLKPHPAFDPQAYLAANPPLAEFAERPLFHYLTIGREAGLPVAPGPHGEKLARVLAAQPHATDFEYSGRRNHYELMRYKQALVKELGVEDGFALYRDLFDLPNSERTERQPIGSLHEYALLHGNPFREIVTAGQRFAIPVPPVIGEGNQRPSESVSRSIFVACVNNARVRGRSGFIQADGLALLDYQGSELAPNDRLDFDPAVFHRLGDTAWMIMPEEGHETIEIDEAFTLLGVYSDAFGHWMLDYLPKYIAATASGALPKVPVLIDQAMPETHRQSLELALPRDVEVVALPSFAAARVGRLWCASSPVYMAVLEETTDPPRPDRFEPSPEHFAAIYRELARRAEPHISVPTGMDRLFLARKPFLRRKYNAAEIEAAAAAHGFVVVYPEDLNFVEQARLLYHARFVVAPNGSASMLAYLARAGTKVCILSHPDIAYLQDATLDELGIELTFLTGPYTEKHEEFQHFSNYEIDPARFADFLSHWAPADTPNARPVVLKQAAPRIAAFLGVMDEIELIERTIDHLYSIGVDLVVACDMGSTDGTLEVLRSRAPTSNFRLLQPKDHGQELVDAWPQTRLELLEQGFDWTLFIDADEYVIPASGSLRDCAALTQADVLYIQSFNVPLGPNGPLMPARFIPDRYEELLLIIKSGVDFRGFRKYLEENPEVAWITGVPEPKMLARSESACALIEGMHNIPAPFLEPLRRRTAADLIIAHVPFTTTARFARKVDNARRALAADDESGRAQGDVAWHWRRWLRLADEGRLDEEFNRSVFTAETIAELRRDGIVRSAAEWFSSVSVGP